MKLQPETMALSLSRLVAYALYQPRWLVIVCPKGSPNFRGFAKVLAGVCPLGSAFSGRTALFPNGSKLSIVESNVPVFVPSSSPFKVIFLGWGSDESSDKYYGDMKKWREAAAGVVSLSSIGPIQVI